MECVELCRVEPIQEGENVLDRDKVSACIEPVMSVAHTTDTHPETPRSYSQMSRGTRQRVVGGAGVFACTLLVSSDGRAGHAGV